MWPTYLPLTTLIPIVLDLIINKPSLKELCSSLWWTTLVSVGIIWCFYNNAKNACQEYEKYVQGIEPDAKKYRQTIESKLDVLSLEANASAYKGRHAKSGIIQTNESINS